MKNILDFQSFINEGMKEWQERNDKNSFFRKNKNSIISDIENKRNYNRSQIEKAFNAGEIANWNISNVNAMYKDIVQQMLNIMEKRYQFNRAGSR